ncbi:MAG: hypothetical protein HDT43_04635 [Ruminococcaceae bacterium]|nr:hypothetical protein [Oscillospiraceae bacterium]
MYRLAQTKRGVPEITFDYFEPVHGLDPFWDIITEYSAETGLQPETVDILFNYKFTEDGEKIQFYWNGGFTVYVFHIPKARYDIVYGRLKNICGKLNRMLAERHYFAKYGKYPNKR